MTTDAFGSHLEGSRTPIAHTLDLAPAPGLEAEGWNQLVLGMWITEQEEPPGPGHQPGGPRYRRWAFQDLPTDPVKPLVRR